MWGWVARVSAVPVVAFGVLCSGDGQAADLGSAPPAVAPLVAPQAPRWSGLYAGLNAGMVFGQADSAFSFNQGPAFGAVSNVNTGALGGLQVGYNWQSGPLVLGAEADFQFASGEGGKQATCVPALCGFAFQASYTNKMPWVGTLRGRVGYVTGTLMIYATGGYAFARLETDASAISPFGVAVASWGDTLQGWTAGGGVEFAINQSWSMKAEYLHLGFGQADQTWVASATAAVSDKTDFSTNVVRAGLNYKF